MDLEKFSRLGAFLQTLESDTYPEPPSLLHSKITQHMVEHLGAKWTLPAGAKVLDVGCGQGPALDQFERRGYQPVGITLNDEDAAVCRAKGFLVRKMDQSFLDFADQEFHLVWCRHCLEHSVFPYFTLSGFHRVLKPEGWLYVEVPAPDTACRHQTNRNHYSVLGKSMWTDLLLRSGFQVVDVTDIPFVTACGPDVYWAFLARK
jgi:ubiquinone/menaquinone biosynthesis C-methylase UbiE